MNRTSYAPLTWKNALGIAAPHTWVAAISPALLGAALSFSLAGAFCPVLFVVLLLAVILMQSAVNTLNDYHDFVKGNDSEDDYVDPSDSVLVYCNVNPVHVRLLGFGFLGGAMLLGCYAVYRGGIAPLLIGAVGCLVILAYSSGHFPISHLPLGEAVSGFVMGGLITLACFASYTGVLRPDLLVLSLPLIIGIALIMLTNNTSDIERDRPVGRKTLPILLGRARAKRLHQALLLLWMLALFALVALRFTRGLWAAALALLPAVPVLLGAFRADLRPEHRAAGMKAILFTNIGAHAAYLAAILAHTALGTR